LGGDIQKLQFKHFVKKWWYISLPGPMQGSFGGKIPITHPQDSHNNAEIKKTAEQNKLHRMAKVNAILEMWQGSENLYSPQKAVHAQNAQMTAMGHISDTEETAKSCWSAIQHDSAAAF
jgi:hypothetical protein